MGKEIHITHGKDWLGREESHGYISETSDTSIAGDLVGSAIGALIELPFRNAINQQYAAIHSAYEIQQQQEELETLSKQLKIILDAVKAQFSYYEVADFKQYNEFVKIHSSVFQLVIKARYKYLLQCWNDIAKATMPIDHYNSLEKKQKKIIANLRLINAFETDDRIDLIMKSAYQAKDIDDLRIILLNLITIMPKPVRSDFAAGILDGYAASFYKEKQNSNQFIDFLKQNLPESVFTEFESKLTTYKKELEYRLNRAGDKSFHSIEEKDEILTWCNMLIILHYKEPTCTLIIKCCQERDSDSLNSLLKSFNHYCMGL